MGKVTEFDHMDLCCGRDYRRLSERDELSAKAENNLDVARGEMTVNAKVALRKNGQEAERNVGRNVCSG